MKPRGSYRVQVGIYEHHCNTLPRIQEGLPKNDGATGAAGGAGLHSSSLF